MTWLTVALAALLVGTSLTWLFARKTSWADNWLPNFIAEWSGILIVVVLVTRAEAAARRREEAVAYATLREKAGLEIASALRPMIDFLLSVAEVTGVRTRPVEKLVEFFDRLFLELPRDGIVDPRACLAQWADTLADVELRLRKVHERYSMALFPDEITQIDKVADALAQQDWLLDEVGKDHDSRAVTIMMQPFIYQATRPLRYLSLYFEEMVGVPLTTGPWHVSPASQMLTWKTMPDEAWEAFRAEERRLTLWTRWVQPEELTDGR
jgi:hypothetical protein